jgi:hypothetical protein
MPFDFPTNPPVDTVYTGVGGYLYTWDGQKWMKGSGTGSATGGYVLKAGDTMLGFLTANADPTAPLHYATKQYVDNILAPLGLTGEALVINAGGTPQWAAPIESGNF